MIFRYFYAYSSEEFRFFTGLVWLLNTGNCSFGISFCNILNRLSKSVFFDFLGFTQFTMLSTLTGEYPNVTVC